MSNTALFLPPPELVIDILDRLNGHRESRPEIPQQISTFFLELTRHIGIPGTPVPRIASLLFSRFIRKHVSDVILEVQKSSDVSWQGTRTNLKNQILLRVVTCISIATKFDSLSPPFTKVSQQILHLLVSLSNPSFTIRSLKKSEIRVLETAKWNIERKTVIDSIQILIMILRLNSVSVDNCSFIPVIHHLLDLFDMCWSSIVAGKFMNVIYMSAVIISVSTFILFGQLKSEKVTEELTIITRFNSVDLFENRDSLLLILTSSLV